MKIKNVYNIGAEVFSSKKKAVDFVRTKLKKLGVSSIDKNHKEFNFFVNLLNNHPDSERKIGCGISKFLIDFNKTNFGTYEITIVRKDKSGETFSWVNCARGSWDKTITKLKKAMRQSISKDILAFKQTAIKKCKICGIINAEFHVDHDNPSFHELSENFLKNDPNHPILFDKDLTTSHVKFQTKDFLYSENWRQYHNKNANLQILCAKCNLTKPKD